MPLRPLARAAAGIVAASAVLGLAACTGGGAPGASSSADETELSVALTIEDDWDPFGDVGGGGVVPLASLVYDALIHDDGTGTLTPGAAESWEFSDDGLALTVVLKPGQTFSDGAALDAAAVKKHFDRGLAKSDSLLPNVTAVEAVDDLTVRFDLSSPNSELPLNLTQISKTGLITSPNATAESLVTTPIGSGPYLLDSQVVDDHAVLVKNPDYRDADRIHIDRIDFSPEQDASSVVKAVQTDVYDLAWVGPASLAEAEAAGLTITESDQKTTVTFDLNVNREPFDDPRVVEALKYAIDRQAVADTVTFGYGTVTDQPVGEGQVGYDESLADLWPYDPDKAKELLAEAGYDEDNPLTFTFKTGEGDTAFPEVIAQQLADIGVTVDIETIPAAQTFPEIYQEKDADVKRGFAPTDPTRSAIDNVWGPDGLVNLSAPVVNDSIQSVSAQLSTAELGSAEHDDLIAEAYGVATREWPSVFLYQVGGFLIGNDRLSDVVITSSRSYGITIDLTDVTVDG